MNETNNTENNIVKKSAVHDGILLVDKQQEWTSFDVVAKLRNVLRTKRMGHAGTLDPNATGLLIVLVGRATKLSETLTGHDKEYYARLRLGTVTDTQDIWGNVTGGNPEAAETVTNENIRMVLDGFRGETDQIPPMYSAIKIKGERLYNIARRGGEVERKPRHIRVEALELLERDGNELSIRVECSSGTYIRTLCHDIGAALGCGACMTELRRTRIGDYRVEDAHRIEEIKDGEFIIGI